MIYRIENIFKALWKRITNQGKLRSGIVIFLAVFLLAFGINTVLRANRGHGSQFDDFVAFSKDLVYDKINIYEAYAYDRTTIGKYPPFFGVVYAALVPLPIWLGAFIWFVSGVVLIIASSRAIVRMAWHFRGGKGEGPPPMLYWVAPLFMALVIILSNWGTSQVNIFIFALVVLGLDHFSRKNDHWAGILIGIATAIKLTPGLFAVYFLYKGQWKTVLWAALGGFICWFMVLPLLLGPDHYVAVMQGWLGTLDGFVTDGAIAEGVVGYRHTNQALEAFFYRFFTHTPADAGLEDFYVNILSISPQVADIIMKVAKVAIIIGLAAVCRTPVGDRKDIRLLFEFSLVVIATLYISPISWLNHFVVVLLPLGALFYYMHHLNDQNPLRKQILWGLVICTVLLNLTHPIFLAFSLTFFGSVYLVVLLVKAIRLPLPENF